MTTSPHRASGPDDSEFDLLVDEPPSRFSFEPDMEAETDSWDRVSPVYHAAPGMPGRGIAFCAILAAAGCALLDFTLTGHLSVFFDQCFVVVCLVGAMAVSRHDLFTPGVLPPLVFGLVIGAVAVLSPGTFGTQGGVSEVFLTGLAQHAGALVFGYGTALVVVAGRVIARRQQHLRPVT